MPITCPPSTRADGPQRHSRPQDRLHPDREQLRMIACALARRHLHLRARVLDVGRTQDRYRWHLMGRHGCATIRTSVVNAWVAALRAPLFIVDGSIFITSAA